MTFRGGGSESEKSWGLFSTCIDTIFRINASFIMHTERFKDYWKLKFLAQGRYDVNDKAGEIE